MAFAPLHISFTGRFECCRLRKSILKGFCTRAVVSVGVVSLGSEAFWLADFVFLCELGSIEILPVRDMFNACTAQKLPADKD